MQNKPNFPNAKMIVTAFYTMTNNNELRAMNSSKQSQTKPNKLEANLAEIPTGELLRILKPGTNQTQFQRRAADEEFNKKGRKRIAYGLSVHNRNISCYKGFPPRVKAAVGFESANEVFLQGRSGLPAVD